MAGLEDFWVLLLFQVTPGAAALSWVKEPVLQG